MQDARTQNQLSNSRECNAADGRLSPCPAGVTQRAQYGVAALDKGTAILCGLRLVLGSLRGSEYNT
jgi:hypothetical protein